jgi:PKD repeat protein
LIYCIGDTTKALTAVGNNLRWYDAATGGTRYATTPTPLSTTASIISYWVSQTNNGCESDRAQLDVEISQAVAVFTKSKDSLCGSELLTLTNNSTTSSAGSYLSKWSFGDGLSSSDSNTTHNYQDARGKYTIQLVVTNVNGCKDSTKQTIEVFKEPVMGMTASDTIICQGGAVDFQGIATPGYSSLTWDFGDGDTAYGENVTHVYLDFGTFIVLCQDVGIIHQRFIYEHVESVEEEFIVSEQDPDEDTDEDTDEDPDEDPDEDDLFEFDIDGMIDDRDILDFDEYGSPRTRKDGSIGKEYLKTTKFYKEIKKGNKKRL